MVRQLLAQWHPDKSPGPPFDVHVHGVRPSPSFAYYQGTGILDQQQHESSSSFKKRPFGRFWSMLMAGTCVFYHHTTCTISFQAAQSEGRQLGGSV